MVNGPSWVYVERRGKVLVPTELGFVVCDMLVETFVELRKTPETEEIPVCVVTGHPEFRKVIYDRPVPPPEGYMDKPVDEEELVSNLKRILDLRDKKG